MDEDPFVEAVAERFGIRAILYGDPGGGKTLTALRMATLLGGPIAFIEADKGRALAKAPRKGAPTSGFKFKHRIVDQFDHWTLVKYIRAAHDHGYQNLIIDSISRFWNDESGLLEYKDKKAKENKKGDFAWGDVNKAQRQIYNAIDDFTGAGGNVILCARRKLLFAKGKDREIIGDAPEFRDDLGYEFDLILRAEANEYTETTADGEQTVVRHELYVRKADIDEYDIDGKRVNITSLLPAGRLIGTDKHHDELPELVELLQEHAGQSSGVDWDGQAQTFIKGCLRAYTSAKALRDAWRHIAAEIHNQLWPPHIKRRVREELGAAGNRMAEVDQGAIGGDVPHGWRTLTMDSPAEAWQEAGTQIMEATAIEEVEAFKQHAKACERFDLVASFVLGRLQELDATEAAAKAKAKPEATP